MKRELAGCAKQHPNDFLKIMCGGCVLPAYSCHWWLFGTLPPPVLLLNIEEGHDGGCHFHRFIMFDLSRLVVHYLTQRKSDLHSFKNSSFKDFRSFFAYKTCQVRMEVFHAKLRGYLMKVMIYCCFGQIVNYPSLFFPSSACHRSAQDWCSVFPSLKGTAKHNLSYSMGNIAIQLFSLSRKNSCQFFFLGVHFFREKK